MTERLNPPPAWPEPPLGAELRESDLSVDASSAAVPTGWRLWTDEVIESGPDGPLAESGDVPSSGVIRRVSDSEYPVDVEIPGRWIEHERTDDDRGFGPAPKRRSWSSGAKLAVSILMLLLGLAAATGMTFVFLRLVSFANNDLSASAAAPSSIVVSAPL